MPDRQLLHQGAEHDSVAAAHIENAQGALTGYGKPMLDNGVDDCI